MCSITAKIREWKNTHKGTIQSQVTFSIHAQTRVNTPTNNDKTSKSPLLGNFYHFPARKVVFRKSVDYERHLQFELMSSVFQISTPQNTSWI